MSKKNYQAIAAILLATGASEATRLRLGAYFATDNPQFVMDRFLAACGHGG
jgi:hypothetical protein